jgi:hypothetical protein
MILRNRRDRKKNPRIFGDDWVTKEERDQHHSEVNNDNDRSNGASPTNAREHPVAIESKRTQKKNRRYIGDEWENDKENEEHVELSGNNQNMCTARVPKKRAIMHAFDWDAMAFEQLERKPRKNFGRHDNPDEPGPSVLREKNRQYFGDDWDNGVRKTGTQERSKGLSMHDDGHDAIARDHMERKPLKHKTSIHEFDWEGMEFEKLQEKPPKNFDRQDDPDEPGPSVLRKKNRRYFGDDWDNGVESDDHQDGCSSQETCIAQFPRRPPVVYQADREMMVNDQHHSKVSNDNDRSNGALPTNSREHPVAIESKRIQKKNRRYIGGRYRGSHAKVPSNGLIRMGPPRTTLGLARLHDE